MLELVEVDVREGLGRTLLLRDFAAKPAADEGNRVFQSFAELLEILFVEEDLMLVVAESAVLFLTALALGDGQVVIVVPLRGFHIEEISTLSCTDRLRIDVLRISLLGSAPLKIFTVHDLVL